MRRQLLGLALLVFSSWLVWLVWPAFGATPLPWHLIGEDELKVITDARLEAQLRLELIKSATHGIDIITYAQTPDESVGLPILTALRDAANRGVHVRFITNLLFLETQDPLSRVAHYLTDGRTVAPLELLAVGSTDESSPWGRGNFAHEKYLIIDRTKVFHTGRMFAACSLLWLDKSYLLKGALAADTSTNFEELWSLLRRPFPPRTPDPVPRGAKPSPYRRYVPPAALALTTVQKRALANALRWFDVPAGAPPAGATMHARLIHYDYLRQLRARHFPESGAERLALLRDPIVEALIERIREPGTREILIGTMSALFRPDLKEALKSALRSGATVHLFVNNASAAETMTPLALNWILSLPDLRELLAAGATVDTFAASREDGYSWTYLHEKLAIVDDTVFFGSHNFSVPSSTNNDESTFEVRGERFAAAMRHQFDVDLRTAGTPLALADVEAQLHGRGAILSLELWLGQLLEWLF